MEWKNFEPFIRTNRDEYPYQTPKHEDESESSLYNIAVDFAATLGLEALKLNPRTLQPGFTNGICAIENNLRMQDNVVRFFFIVSWSLCPFGVFTPYILI